MTIEEVMEINAIHARLYRIEKEYANKPVPSFAWYEREIMRDRLRELGVDIPGAA